MKRFLTALLALFTALCSQAEMFDEESAILKVAYLGDYDSMEALRQSENFKRYLNHYPELAEINAFTVETQGKEIYFLQPKDSQADVSIYGFNIEMINESKPLDSGKLYYQGKGKPFLVRINMSDIHSDITVFLKDATGQSVIYQPSLSSEDNSLTLRNLLKPDDEAPTELFDIGLGGLIEPQQKDETDLGIKAQIQAGKVIVTVDNNEPELKNYLSAIRVEGSREVKGLAGKATGIYVSDIGQDYNPILCVLNEKGELQMLSLFHAIEHDDFQLSPVLFERVRYFSYMPNENYANILVVDEEYDDKEVEFAFINGERSFRNPKNGEIHRLHLTPDWKVDYQITDSQGKQTARYQGTFNVIPSTLQQFDEASYQFRFPQGVTDVAIKMLWGEAWEISPIQGDVWDFGSDGGAVIYTKDGKAYTPPAPAG